MGHPTPPHWSSSTSTCGSATRARRCSAARSTTLATSGLVVRRGTELRLITPEAANHAADIINNRRRRRSLNYRTQQNGMLLSPCTNH